MFYNAVANQQKTNILGMSVTAKCVRYMFESASPTTTMTISRIWSRSLAVIGGALALPCERDAAARKRRWRTMISQRAGGNDGLCRGCHILGVGARGHGVAVAERRRCRLAATRHNAQTATLELATTANSAMLILGGQPSQPAATSKNMEKLLRALQLHLDQASGAPVVT